MSSAARARNTQPLSDMSAALLPKETRLADRHGLSSSVSVGMAHRHDCYRCCPSLPWWAAVTAVSAALHRRGCPTGRDPPTARIRGCRPRGAGWHCGQGRPRASPPPPTRWPGPLVASGSRPLFATPTIRPSKAKSVSSLRPHALRLCYLNVRSAHPNAPPLAHPPSASCSPQLCSSLCRGPSSCSPAALFPLQW